MAKTQESGNVILPSESAEAIKANLRLVAEEIARVRDRTREEAESLERIRGMLDLKTLTDLLSTVERLETRVRSMERTPVSSEAKRWKTELESEQRRLAKLWDAFKTQEDQVKGLERERDEILKEYKTFERQMQDLGSPSQVRTRLITLQGQNQRLKNDTASATARSRNTTSSSRRNRNASPSSTRSTRTRSPSTTRFARSSARKNPSRRRRPRRRRSP